MRIVSSRAYEGRNVYSHYPVIRLEVDLEDLAERQSHEFEGFIERLLACLPGLQEHHCSRQYPGGFVERLREGTFFGHIVEHTALELQSMAGLRVVHGKTRRVADRVYAVIYEHGCSAAGLRAGEAALRLVDGLRRNEPVDPLPIVAELKRLVAAQALGPSTESIVAEARRRGIPVIRLSDASLVQLGYGRWQRRIQASITSRTSCVGVDVAGDKTLTKHLLTQAGIPVPPGEVVRSEEQALAAARRIGLPVAIKPVDGNQGKGVTLNLQTVTEVRAAYKVARNYSDRVMVEQHVPGRHYRVLVVGGRVVASAERIPAHVTGDGRRTVRALIDEANRDPNRGEGHEKPLTRIHIDPVVLMVLARQNRTLNYVPAAGEVVYLRENANLSTGGQAVDATDELSPENEALCIRAAGMVGLDIAGIDLVAPNLRQPLRETGGAVIEVNAAPGLRMHLYPSQGMPRDVAKPIVDWLFPPGRPVRSPVVAVTGTNGKTTVTRMIGHMLSEHGLRVGMTTTDGIRIGGQLVVEGDTTGPRSARTVLLDPTVDVAVLETARGGLVRGGLAFDVCDVAVVTNISEDHLGQDGIETLEDLVWVKSLLVEAVPRNGTAVLNADDPLVLGMASRNRGRLILFSLEEDNLAVRKHLTQGGRAIYLRDGQLFAADPAERPLARVDDLPSAWSGAALHNVANAMAAAAAAMALGLPDRSIVRGLTSFGREPSHNPGRLNVYRVGEATVIFDYGHNPAGFERALASARLWQRRELVGVIGVPGDRRNETVVAAGRVAGRGFDRIWIKEDADLRGRAPGEIAALLLDGVLQTGLAPERVHRLLDEAAAVRRAVQSLQTGDVLIVFYEKLRRVLEAAKEAAQTRGESLAPVTAGAALRKQQGQTASVAN